MREIEKINHTGEVPVMEPQRQFYFMDLAKQYVCLLYTSDAADE